MTRRLQFITPTDGSNAYFFMPYCSLEEQLELSCNYIERGQLYLTRCVSCSDDPRGKENYMSAAATGRCAWCGWHV